MIPQSVGRISLKTTNYRGSYYFMPLKTERIIHARQWTVLHVTESVIDRVEKIADSKDIDKKWIEKLYLNRIQWIQYCYNLIMRR